MTDHDVPSTISFRAIRDEPTGAALAPIFAKYWPAYRKWMHRTGSPSAQVSVGKLQQYMPELVPVFEQLIHAFGCDEEIQQFLALYNPPRIVRACSQFVLDDQGPVLIRSYDHHPNLLDDLVLHSAWLGNNTIALADCLWGALDGMNDHGLAIALAFGGRNTVGDGFAAPLINRYILETCATVEDATHALKRIPVYMPYTFVVVDVHGSFVTAYASPDSPTRFVTKRASTNHQTTIEWPEYCASTKSVERLSTLESLLATPTTATQAIDTFLQPPLWRTNYAQASGTLYVAAYRPGDRSLTLHWPAHQERFVLGDCSSRAFTTQLPSEVGSP